MKGIFFIICFFILFPIIAISQQISYSDVLKESSRSREMNFEIIGKVNNNILVFKNQSAKYAISIYQGQMDLKDKIDLDFIPSKAYNVDFVVFPDFFYLVYQYQKRGTIYCMAAKLDGNAKLFSEPVL